MKFTLTELNNNLDKFYKPHRCPFQVCAALPEMFQPFEWFSLDDPIEVSRRVFYKTKDIGFVQVYLN